MTDTTNYTDYTIITAKDIESLCLTISERTAEHYYTDIKREFGIKRVMFKHFKLYFKV